MFFAAGVGAYHVAMFHLFAHAFFKHYILGAGSVIPHLRMSKTLEIWAEFEKDFPLLISLCYRDISFDWISFLSGFYSKDIIISCIPKTLLRSMQLQLEYLQRF